MRCASLSNPVDLFGGSFGFSLDYSHAQRALLSNPADLVGGSFAEFLENLVVWDS
jgi:hypothetical protein